MAEAPGGSCCEMLATFRRNSSHICGMRSARIEGDSSMVIFESPYCDSETILWTSRIDCISRSMGSVMSISTSSGEAPG